MPFNTLAASTKTALTELAEAVSTVQPTETKTFSFKTGTLAPAREPLALVTEVGGWAQRRARYVYFFEVEADDSTLAALHQAFKAARDAKVDGRAYARIFSPNRMLYVGSSSDLKARFRQHLGYCKTKTTSAMQLAYWATVCDVSVRFTAARYAPTVSDAVLGALEDQLWSQLRPMMGRQGRK